MPAESSKSLRELEPHRFHGREICFDRVIPSKTRQQIVRLLTDVHLTGLFPTYAAHCYLVSSIVLLLLKSRNIEARLVDCGAMIHAAGRLYRMGLGGTREGQIDGHAAVLTDSGLLIDVGLGAVSKYLLPGFPQGIICYASSANGEMARAQLPTGEQIIWTPISEPVQKGRELSAQQPIVKQLITRWQRATATRR